MAFRPLNIFAWLTMFSLLVGCGPQSSDSGKHSFAGSQGEVSQAEVPPAENPSSQKSETPQVITEKTDIPLTSFEMPKVLQDHLTATEQPELVQNPSTGFSVYNQYMQIDPKTSVLTFAGVLRIKGKKDEAVQLSCTIDKAKAWSCNNMFPVDAKVRAQRRLQATARCVDANICKQVGVKLFVLIDGKIETQSFFSYKFQAWKASSGDTAEELDAAAEPAAPVSDQAAPAEPPTDPVVLEKPTPAPQDKPPVTFDAPASQAEVPLTDEEIALILNNEGWEQESESTAVEYSAPVNTPSPGGGESAIPDIQQQFPQMNKGVRDQAMGFHNRGSLSEAKALPKESAGITAKSPGVNNYGTDLTVSMLKAAAKEVNRVVPGRAAFRVTSISSQYGGKLRPHSSHQSGLDIDVGFPSTDKSVVFGAACAPLNGNKCAQNATVSSAFDEKRFYLFLKSMNCAENAPVMAMFLDKVIKKHMCNWAKENLDDLDQKNSCTAKIFRALHHENGHHNHIHIRLKCPGNESCSQNMIPLQAKTGC